MPFTPRSEFATFWRTNSSLDAPNMYTYAIQGSYSSPEIMTANALPDDTWSMFVGMRPQSRGRVYLRKADGGASVGIDSRYFERSEGSRRFAIGPGDRPANSSWFSVAPLHDRRGYIG